MPDYPQRPERVAYNVQPESTSDPITLEIEAAMSKLSIACYRHRTGSTWQAMVDEAILILETLKDNHRGGQK